MAAATTRPADVRVGLAGVMPSPDRRRITAFKASAARRAVERFHSCQQSITSSRPIQLIHFEN